MVIDAVVVIVIVIIIIIIVTIIKTSIRQWKSERSTTQTDSITFQAHLYNDVLYIVCNIKASSVNILGLYTYLYLQINAKILAYQLYHEIKLNRNRLGS